jgi:hypothetical protein
MFSVLKPGYIYSNFSEDVADHDDDYDAEEWNYNGREVFRGCLDPAYPDWNVYWLYDDNLVRVGLAEHDPEAPEVFHSLWFYDNPFGTLFQESNWVKKNTTLWSLLSPEAYQDCLEDDFKTVFDRALGSNIRLMTPGFITHRPKVYHCQKCNKKSLSSLCSDSTVYDYLFSDFSILFLDDSFVVYTAPSDSKVWSHLSLNPPQPDACVPEHQEQPPEQADPPESQTAQSPLEVEQSQQEPETQELQPQ